MCPYFSDDIVLCSNYVNQATAVAQNLTYASGNTLVLRADHTTTLSASGPGRNSVRIRSVKTYTTHVSVYVSLLSMTKEPFINVFPLIVSISSTCHRDAVLGLLHGKRTKVIGRMEEKLTL